MAYTAHTDPSKLEEIEETIEAITQKAKQLASMMRESKHCVFFTGAGISTSAGIPSFRGPEGIWTLLAQDKEIPKPLVEIEAAVPTKTHMAIVQLMETGLVKFLISQNIDGMHRKSGVPSQKLAELHGNTNVEVCMRCGKEYLRDYRVDVYDGHETGRRCAIAGCHGRLKDTIINFGDKLPVAAVGLGFSNSEKADLHVVLGSSLVVRPASDMPRETATNGGRLVIVNLQRTPLDDLCAMRVHGKCDQFVELLMNELGFSIPPFVLHRNVVLWRENNLVRLAGVEEDGTPATLFPKVIVDQEQHEPVDLDVEPFVFRGFEDQDVKFTLIFFGHYNEPRAQISLLAGQELQGFHLQFDVANGKDWIVDKADLALPELSSHVGDQPDSPDEVDVTDVSGWHAVSPLADCPHTEMVVPPSVSANCRAKCHECGNVGENMLCLGCSFVGCGRHVRKHMLAHHERTQHPIVCGFVDLSFWCYPCESYIDPNQASLEPYYKAYHLAKFGVAPPKCTK
eukprot:TRINITY_DN1364_c0_g1_i1.p1 TRINITY_DN1364_c0_g1~~TRINITY_DN1364_c0_g1_i1.p1  ORF type:complete len:527 (-),score=53.23 TRINITY_DN1364_c0_g1_i1:70-1602(-)